MECGIILPGGSNISTVPAYTSPEESTHSRPADSVASSSPIRRVRERHPACECTALEFARELGDYTKGMSQSERMRHSQALAYISYRSQGQTHVTVSTLASEIRVTEERLSKDVRAVVDKLGIRGWQDDLKHEDEDEDAFAKAMLRILRPGTLTRGTRPQVVNRWCRSLFVRTVDAGEVDIANLAPKHQADAAAAVYCEKMGNPFVAGLYGPPKCTRGKQDDECLTAVRALLRNAAARRAADILRKFAIDPESKPGSDPSPGISAHWSQ